jgi:hypothetical protein
VAGVVDRNRAHRVYGCAVEREISGEIPHQLAKAAAAIKDDHTPTPLLYDRIGVDEQLATPDQIEDYGSWRTPWEA